MAQAQNTSADAVSALQPLSYLNANQAATVLFTQRAGAPQTTDRRFKFGTLWLDTTNNAVYSLVSVVANSATWSLLGPGASDVDTLTGDTGGAISPAAGNINILGGDGLTVAGAGSTLTINQDTDSYPAYLFVVGTAGEAGYTTIQAALDAIGAAGTGQIFLQPGTYTENLVYPDGINCSLITGSDEDAGAAEVVGVHTPPATGNIVCWRVKMTSASHIFSSAVAGSANITLVHNNYSVNGYIWNLPNWTGVFAAGLIADRASASSGIVNNSTGTAALFLFSSDLGVGSANPGTIGGLSEIQQCGIGCPMTYSGSSTVELARNVIEDTQTFTGSVSGGIHNSYFSTGSSEAISYGTSGNIVLSDCTITSSNDPAIDGAGAGTLTISSVAFTSNSNLGGSLTVAKGTLTTGTVRGLTFDTDVAAAGVTLTATTLAADGTDVNIPITVTPKGTGNLAVGTGISTPLYTVAAATDLLITSATGQDIIMKMGDAVGVNKVSFTNSADAEVFAIDSFGALTLITFSIIGAFTQTGGAVSISQDNAGNSVGIANGTIARAVTLASSAAAHTVAIGSATGAASLDLRAGTGNFTLEGATATTYDISATGVNTGTITMGGGTGAQTMNLATGGTGVKTVNIGTGAIGNIVTIGTVTAAASLDLLVGTGNFTLEGNIASTYGISTTGANTGQIDIGTGTGAQTMNLATGGTGIKRVSIATGAIDNVVTIGSATGAASLDLLCGTGNFTLDGSGATTYTVGATTTGGTITIGGTAQTGTMTLGDSSGVNIVQIGSGEGATTVNIAAGATGAKVVNIATGAVANTTIVGTVTGSAATSLLAGTGGLTLTGTIENVDAKFVVPTGADINFNQSPVVTTADDTGGMPTGITGGVNIMSLQEGVMMEQFIIGAGQTIIAPRMDATGLSCALDQVSTSGVEYNFGAARINSKHAFTIGTSAAFFFEVEFNIQDMSACNPFVMGFRKSEANNATMADYTDYITMGMNSASSATEIVSMHELNGGGQTITNTTDLWGGDGTANILRILVSAAGVVDVTINGSSPSVAPLFTFDTPDVVVPYMQFVQSADLSECHLISMKVGFQ